MEFTPYDNDEIEKLFLSPQAIIRIRKALKLTQAQFGSLLGSHAVTVNRWEKSKLKPTPYQVALIRKFGDAACKIHEHNIANTIVGKGVIPTLFLLLKLASDSEQNGG